jgi:hypothetical protein
MQVAGAVVSLYLAAERDVVTPASHLGSHCHTCPARAVRLGLPLARSMCCTSGTHPQHRLQPAPRISRSPPGVCLALARHPANHFASRAVSSPIIIPRWASDCERAAGGGVTRDARVLLAFVLVCMY